jgi:[acyl-carrier-protein] S-malonyltransferase
LAKHRGAKRAILLPVSAPFHCALMQPAQDRLAADLAALTFHAPEVPVVCNVDAALITTADQARDALIRQVTGSVQWDKSVRALIALGVRNFVEVGPGKVLCGLIRQIDRSSACVNVEDEASLQKTANNFSSASPKPD